ncbi:NADH dehydrogenase [ubiquinone] 1 beta subcomplex subunit 11, mitochondrial [Acipenser ruthenus]|uniref:NADH dehydrogenase [ubiquinone] 1 beta subcomplex subunit 11, mitochondrial n=1 Tax=Acipenser ruthenus TaxID=7906 RepID=A0A444UIT3_ACIRT|nr:NADH dehydrogenase [ubiquinone] 1 beta subcomplex subunit 11, mitochondrial [Acipenser ruthenus]RXM35073.1 NADH dehydrogenase [ubiquinone] 1 beta subcomplex subunit 11, mitochondrial [Acipenser ruthenus]
MASRLVRILPAWSRVRLGSVAGARFVSQTPSPGAAGSPAVSSLSPAEHNDDHGHVEVSLYEKNRDFHGFHKDPQVDVWNMKVAFFFGISVAIVIGGTFIHYLPDHGMRQWARREAERLIKEREAKGVAVLDGNYYDPSKIILPSAEEEK